MPKRLNTQSNVEIKVTKKTPPTKPSHDFFGEIFGAILCLPKAVPKRYAPVSFSQMHAKKNISIGKSKLDKCKFVELIKDNNENGIVTTT